MTPQIAAHAGAFVAIVCALFLLLTAINLARALFGRGGTLAVVAPVIIAGGLLAAGSIYFVQTSVAMTATPVARREAISIAFGGLWWRTTDVDVRFQPDAGSQPLVDRITLDAATFDQIRQGAPMAIRYLPSLPAFARLDQESTPATAAALLPASPQVIGGALASLLALWLFVYAIGAGRVGGALVVAMISAAIAAVVVARPALAPPLAPGPRRATAQVSRIDTVLPPGGPLERVALPFDVVVLTFTPQGLDHQVQVVDSVDDGSVPDLRVGQDLPIGYGADPRAARVVGAMRRNEWADRVVVVGLVALVEIAVCLAALMRRAAPVRTVANAYRMRRLGPGKIEASALITSREAAKRFRGAVKPPEVQETRNVDGSIHSLCLLIAASSGEEIQVQVDQADAETPASWNPRTRWDVDMRAIAEYGGRMDPVRNLGVEAYWTGMAILNVLTRVATLRFVFPDGNHRGLDERLARNALARLGDRAPTNLVVSGQSQATVPQ